VAHDASILVISGIAKHGPELNPYTPPTVTKSSITHLLAIRTNYLAGKAYSHENTRKDWTFSYNFIENTIAINPNSL
jgi:hypothetical protein